MFAHLQQSPIPAAEEAGLILRTLQELGQDLLGRLPFAVVAAIIFVLFILFGQAVKLGIHAAARRTPLTERLGRLLGRLATVTSAILGLLVGAVIVFPAFRPGDLVAGLGLTSVAIGFAFKDILQNFVAGLFLLWRQPFEIGDQIRVKDYEGTVEDIQFRSTRLITYDGERAILPNNDVYTSAVLVRTAFPARRLKYVVGIGYPESIEEARRVIEEALQRAPGVLNEPAPWVYVSEFAPSSVNFNVFFWARSDQTSVLRAIDQAGTEMKRALDAARIEIPYPHTVLLVQDQAPHPPEHLLRPAA
ncbi:MAG: mechanosensitive ion channel family protein [Bryobacteraceae bacterium]